MQALLGSDLIGLYLGGSFATGDFVPGVSDYDLLAVCARDLSDAHVGRLRTYHATLAVAEPESLRLEGDYAPRASLVAEGTTEPAWWFRDGALQQPEFMLSADNIANMRADGIALYGPPPRELLPVVTPDDVRAAVRNMLAEAPDASSERAAAHEILGVARSLAALETGTPTSNLAGLRWALTHMERRWQDVVRRAAEVRGGAAVDESDDHLRRALVDLRRSLHLDG